MNLQGVNLVNPSGLQLTVLQSHRAEGLPVSGRGSGRRNRPQGVSHSWRRFPAGFEGGNRHGNTGQVPQVSQVTLFSGGRQIKEKKVFILAESYELDKKELLTAEKVLSSFQLETAVACNT